jgi:long-chain fatty acid transport protein
MLSEVNANQKRRKTMSYEVKRICIAASIAAGTAVVTQPAGAAGFALLEQNASGLGNAYAGSAASATDASTIYFNPAGLTLLPGMQAVIAGSAINVQSSFSGTARQTPTGLIPLGTNDGGNAGGWSFVPSAYFSAPIGERWAVGIGAGAPFGLKTEYESNWMGRFLGIKSELTTVNINPSVAFKVNENISLGAGVNWQKADATLSSAVVLPTPSPLVFVQGVNELKADDDAWGWNVGALFKLGSDMRVGVSYRSSIDYTLSGNVTTTGPTGAIVPAATFPATADVKFPDMAIVSVVQQFGEKWQLLGDLQYTHWSTVGTINVVNSNNGVTADTLRFDFEDAWRVALGVNYFSSEKWTIRGGLAWDQSPVNDQNRTVRLPDNDRFWVALGAQYKFGKGGAVDVGYSHLFVQSPSINQTKQQPGTVISNNVAGDYDSSVDIIGVQFTWTF